MSLEMPHRLYLWLCFTHVFTILDIVGYHCRTFDQLNLSFKMDCGLIISLLLSFCLKETIAVSCRRLEVPLQRVSFVAFFFFSLSLYPRHLNWSYTKAFRTSGFWLAVDLTIKQNLSQWTSAAVCWEDLLGTCSSLYFLLFYFVIMVFNESNTLSFRYTFNKILPSFPGAATAWCSSQHSYWNLAQIDNCFVFVFNSWPFNACINK